MTAPKKTILVANGVNLDLLGSREEDHYGTFTLSDLEKSLVDFGNQIAKVYKLDHPILEFVQSNSEETFLQALTQEYKAFIINAAAWTHTSIALRDRLIAVGVPYYEVHISNVHARESFRHKSYIAEHSVGVVSGLGIHSYHSALLSLLLS